MDGEVKYHLEATQLGDAWDSFVSTSPNSTAFVYSKYLEALQVNVQPYYCYKKQELMGAVLCILSKDSNRIIGHEYVIYDGLMYRDLSHLNQSQRFSEEFKIQQCVAQSLAEIYSEIRLSLHPTIIDIRPFLWVNYTKKTSRYVPDIRYTSYVSISDFKHAKKLDDIGRYKDASVARRQEIRYSQKKNVNTEQVADSALFISYYKKTMARQGINNSSHILNNMKELLHTLLSNKSCVMIQSSDSEGRVGSMAIFLLDQRRAYYLFGANDPKMRSQHTGTAVLWDSFYLLADLGFLEVDLEGINSPNRGWFKLSFGGSCVPYYVMNFE